MFGRSNLKSQNFKFKAIEDILSLIQDTIFCCNYSSGKLQVFIKTLNNIYDNILEQIRALVSPELRCELGLLEPPMTTVL